MSLYNITTYHCDDLAHGLIFDLHAVLEIIKAKLGNDFVEKRAQLSNPRVDRVHRMLESKINKARLDECIQHSTDLFILLRLVDFALVAHLTRAEGGQASSTSLKL